jgi:hypothetical protein
MPGLLQGQLASQIYAGFQGKLLKGTLRRPAPSGGLDSFGDPNAVQILTWPCQGFVEGYNDFFRLRALIPETDSKVNIFAKSLPAGVAPLKDDQVLFNGQWWQLRRAQTDPATALWVCQAFVATRVPS